MKMYRHRLPHEKLTTCNMGNIIPITNYPALPGDIIRAHSDIMIRTQPLQSPAFSRATARVYHFAIPIRQVFSGFEDFRTGGKTGVDATLWPYVVAPVGGWLPGSLMDQLGAPTGVAGIQFDATILRAYGSVVNKYFIDKDLQIERVVSLAAGLDTTTDLTLANGCWEKDLYSTARATPQSGSAVTIPLTGNAPVRGLYGTAANSVATGTAVAIGGAPSPAATSLSPPDIYVASKSAVGTAAATALNSTNATVYADMAGVSAVNISDLRMASNIERFKELISQFGHTLPEFYKLFGIRPQDSRMQWPELLASGSSTLQFSEVLQTAEGTDPVGEMRGHGIGAMRSNRFTYKVFEDTIMMSILIVRPNAVYSNGLRKDQTPPTSRYDMFHPQMQNLGQLAMLNKEIDAANASPNGVFGYQNQNYHLMDIPSQVSGDFKPGQPLEEYTQARAFVSPPALNASFVECIPSDRIFASSSAQLYVRAMHKVKKLSLLRTGNHPRLL